MRAILPLIFILGSAAAFASAPAGSGDLLAAETGNPPAVSQDSTAVEKPVLTLRSETRVPGAWITLGDIAEVTGGDSAVVREAKALKLAHAPMPGAEKVMDREELARHLKRLGWDGKVAVAESAAPVRITAAVKVVPGSELAAFGRKFLEEKLARRGITIEITDPATPRSAVLPDVPTEMKAEMSSRGTSGLVAVAVEVWAEGKRETRILLSYRVRSRGPVAQAGRDLEAGDVITQDDLVETEMDLAGLPGDAVTAASSLTGLKVLRPITTGSVIRKGAVAIPTMVKKGESVMLSARVGSVEARAMALVKEDGANGETVTVMNLESRRMVKAKVTGVDTVEALMP